MKKTKTTRHQSAGRKPIRPIERQKMRPWLYNLLLNHDVPSLQWEVKREGLFRIAWRHAARQGWNPREDADLFERWARHTGKYVDGDEPDPKRWKANFRCALNSLPDVEELKERGMRKGNNAFKIYRFLDAKKHKSKTRQHSVCKENVCAPKRTSKRLQDKPYRRFVDSDSEEDEMEMSDSDESHSTGRRDSDEVSSSGSEPDFILERTCRLSSESSELPVFEKICGESDLPIFQNDKNYQSYQSYQNYLSLPGSTVAIYDCNNDDDDECSTDGSNAESNMTEEELVELIISGNHTGDIIEIKQEEIDIWSAVAADVTVGAEEMVCDGIEGCVIQESKNVITEQLINSADMSYTPYTSLDPSLL